MTAARHASAGAPATAGPSRMRRAAGAVAAGFAVLFPILVGGEEYLVYNGCVALIVVLLATGYNILIGMCGQFAMSHVAFFGIGAYASALLTRDLGWPYPLALAAALALPMLAALAMARAAVRLTGPYLAMVTFAFHSMALTVFTNWTEVTNGWGGVSRIPPIAIAGERIDTPVESYYLILGCAALGLAFAQRLKVSRFGRAFYAVRENRLAARGVGIDAPATITLAFCVSGAYAGLAGSLDAHFVRYIDPTSFGLTRLIDLLIVIVVGGRGSVLGVAVAAIGFVFALEYLRFLQDWKLMIFGLLLIVLINASPNGLGELIGKLRRRRAA